MRAAMSCVAAACVALCGVACGGSGSETGDGNRKTLEQLWRAPGADVAVVAGTANHVPGPEVRFSFLVVDAEGQVITLPTAKLWVARELEAKPFLESSAKLERIGIPGGAEADSTHIYVARVPLREPGTYWFMAEPEGGKDPVQALGNVVVSNDDPEPGAGDRAPPSANPTLASVGGVASRITTRTPPDEILLVHTVAESVRNGIPFVVTFSTPKYCTSRTCGPTVDVVEEVARRFEDRDVRFIHIEVYEDNDPAKGFNKWMREWDLETEPWTFVVGDDGRIVESYEGPVSVSELEEALEALVPE